MNNREVAAAFVRGVEGEGSNLRAERPTTQPQVVLYSYATPIAYWYSDEHPVFMDEHQYSVTTAKQKSYVRHAAASAGKEVVNLPTGEFREKVTLLGGDTRWAR